MTRGRERIPAPMHAAAMVKELPRTLPGFIREKARSRKGLLGESLTNGVMSVP